MYFFCFLGFVQVHFLLGVLVENKTQNSFVLLCPGTFLNGVCVVCVLYIFFQSGTDESLGENGYSEIPIIRGFDNSWVMDNSWTKKAIFFWDHKVLISEAWKCASSCIFVCEFVYVRIMGVTNYPIKTSQNVHELWVKYCTFLVIWVVYLFFFFSWKCGDVFFRGLKFFVCMQSPTRTLCYTFKKLTFRVLRQEIISINA